ncbi:hypothetical protein B9Q04_04960 [Candidatus Marsarchaeota G2 archaeon BE_D]|uniref:Glycosyltransferase 2-like domain-containing protein n=1 Tax=Candidatus Marsarchaeota G2 archaeon BE_D TaxID=1978158 RepID=A0A2R6CCC3_9ARCH|nr:MAG: hypothetical protein B9Q04_04960 [Candidatus Marsarchaeota G2 archaeon BE_D]
MRLSVIITGYTKRPFIKEAILSVLNQTLKKDRYEIIFVKNYEDREIDQWLNSKGLKNITVSDTSLGGKIRIGVQESSGDVLSLLEDDDQFYPSKLEQVQKVFQNKSIGYFHNNYSFFYDNMEITNNVSQEGIMLLAWKADNLLNLKTLNQALKMGISFNNSCISLRRELLESFSQKLTGYTVSVDYAIFFLTLNASLQRNYGLALSTGQLTRYRISPLKEKRNVEDLYLSRLIEGLKTLKMLIEQLSSTELKSYLDYTYHRSKLILNILREDTRGTQLATLETCLKLLKKPMFIDHLSSSEPNYKFILAGLTSLTIRSYVKKMLLKRWEKFYDNNY